MLEEYGKKDDEREERGKRGKIERKRFERGRFANFLGKEKLDYEI